MVCGSPGVHHLFLPPFQSKLRAEPSAQLPFSAPQLEKEEQIHSVDIGNDGSAFVEVLVGSSAAGATAGEQDYEVKVLKE